MKSELTIVMPVYNEEECIRGVLCNWVRALNKLHVHFQILALNDGSLDQTERVTNQASVEFPEIIAVTKTNSGHGPTILMGYRRASQESPWIFQVDSDDEMGPESFYRLWNERENYDFLLGCRDRRRQPFSRKIISWISRSVIRICYGCRIRDVNSPYRLFRAAVFKDVVHQIPDNTFAPNLILSGFCSLKKLRVLEVPVPQTDRKTGEVSIKKWRLLIASLRAFCQTIAFRSHLR
jgi:dolichol-phosphate mannosyltransferase